jgi:hypothetical protein
MFRCPSCDYPLPPDRERMGARCPNCRDPLYEPPTRLSRPASEGESACAVHPGRQAVGACGRCGNYACEVCRTPWREHSLCAACVDRILEKQEALPEQVRTHKRQAIVAMCLGGGSWVLAVLTFLLVGVAGASGNQDALMATAMLAFFFLAANTCGACIGIGHGVAALRTRGPYMVVATIGVILGALYIGVLIGFFSLTLYSS